MLLHSGANYDAVIDFLILVTVISSTDVYFKFSWRVVSNLEVTAEKMEDCLIWRQIFLSFKEIISLRKKYEDHRDVQQINCEAKKILKTILKLVYD